MPSPWVVPKAVAGDAEAESLTAGAVLGPDGKPVEELVDNLGPLSRPRPAPSLAAVVRSLRMWDPCSPQAALAYWVPLHLE